MMVDADRERGVQSTSPELRATTRSSTASAR